MGLEVTTDTPPPALADVLERLSGAGVNAMIAMVDGSLVAFGAPPPQSWREVRLRTPAGTVTVTRRGAGVAVTVFGNADDALRAAQQRIADAFRGA
jgi:hypothetical protein